MKLRHAISIVLVWAVVTSVAAQARGQDAGQADDGRRQISAVRGQLFEVRDGMLRTVFFLTSDGVILADPLGPETAQWLKREFQSRYQARARYVLLTSHDAARASGTEVFNGSADVVAQSTFARELVKARATDPARYAFDVQPTLIVAATRLIRVREESVAQIRVPLARAPETTVVYFPRERVVFASNPPDFLATPFSFGATPFGDIFTWVDILRPLDFDEILTGDGQTVTRRAFDDVATYLTALRAAVVSGASAGQSLAAAMTSAALAPFRSDPRFSAREDHARAIDRGLTWWDLNLGVGGAGSLAWRAPVFCDGYTNCNAGGAVGAGRLSVSMTPRRGLGFGVEFTLSGQTWGGRTLPSKNEDVAVKRSRTAFLARYGRPMGRFSASLLAGPSVTGDDIKGLDQVKNSVRPEGGYHQYAQHHNRVGATIGVELSRVVGRRVSIRVPVRYTRMSRGPASSYFLSDHDLQAGVDLAFRLSHQVSLR
jgi:hypothetical protein